ncbi:MerR family transcriptional regulator [Pelodictyon luteolum]|uniref:Transcriptional regulator, MerR family n=1 Tax=Chlorobium luteolum (strain DSM 273 / BCRC 81028 / 2530) TaxID=319225 RepID=Q3B2S1_CHLL3|nr:MerR family transcriptional regulator [Pelodictyon luteolum]ABB24360.1 transcriptional regulator, MerR family [Pelodictyon luteolum DSM 273]
MPFDASKNYYSIGEVSRIAGVPAYLLRYWETFFKELRPGRDTRGNRRYTNRDMALVLNIKDLVYEQGYRLGKASELMKNEGKTRDEDPRTGEILRLQKEIGHVDKKNRVVDQRRVAVLKEVKSEIEEILQLLG